ncbi:MAG TPA: PQQ-binding-like beta-propeller repeat protein [Tepidisphaeraceae bacterium]|jgi:outer membrane protein assembly factor BamB|nr:PQQ-binding-like beta-propeller repeat protein [Tepidisphaeraceae bacterium]
MKCISRPLTLFVGISLFLATANARGQEWIRFRGPNGSGISESTFPAKFTEHDIAWNVALPGTGHSSPVIWGDKIFITSTDEALAHRIVACLSAKDGSLLWKREFPFGAYRKHGDNSYTSATPAVDADRVYVCWNAPEEFTLMALDHKGADAWKIDLGAFISQHGGGNSPIVVGDVVVLGDDQEGAGSSFVFGVDRATGKIIWKTPRKTAKFSAATPVVFHPQSGPDQVVITSQAEGMTGIDPKTGKVVWQAAGIFDSRTVGSPTVGDGLIFATCGEGPGGHFLNAVRPGADGSAKIAWKIRSETPYVPTPLARGDRLFYWSDRGMVTCADAATGKTIWQDHVPGSYYSSPVCAGEVLFNVTKKGEVVAISAGEKFQLLGQTALNDKCQATIAISGGRMYIRTLTHLFAIKGIGGQAMIDSN